jgi:hypothetical protein
MQSSLDLQSVNIITFCASWNTEKRSYRVCVLLFVINAALVIATIVHEDIFLSILWIICLAINGSALGRKR